MSTPGKDNLSSEQRRKVNRENQKASAIGNKSVESATAKTEAPQMRSVNEPVTPAPLLSNEQIAANRQENLNARQQVLDNAEQELKSTPMKEVVKDIAPGPQSITAQKRGFVPEVYEYKPLSEEAIEKAVKSNRTLASIIDTANKQDEEARVKAEDASRMAKANALGNLLVALGQMAGGGQATYVKPTTSRYLTESMKKVDQAREMYDKIRATNADKRRAAEQSYIDELKKNHLAAETLRKEAIENRNKINQKAYVDNQKLKLQEEKNKIDSDYKNGLISLKEYQNQTSRISALASLLNAQTNADKQDRYTYPLRFTDTDTNTQYKLDDSTIKQIAAMMRSTGAYDKGTTSLLDKIAMSDSDIDYTKEANLQIKVQEFIDKNIASNEKLRKLISTVPREKVTSKPLPAKYNL